MPHFLISQFCLTVERGFSKNELAVHTRANETVLCHSDEIGL